MGAFKEPHGDVLKQLYLTESAAEQEKLRARDYRSWDLTARQLCDIELILNGAFSPLEGFLTEAEYERVVREMRLPSGVLWPMPVTLDVSAEFARQDLQGRAHRTARSGGRADRDDGGVGYLGAGQGRRIKLRVRHAR